MPLLAARRLGRAVSAFGTVPGFAILLTVLALNLVGEGSNDALDPRLNQGRAS